MSSTARKRIHGVSHTSGCRAYRSVFLTLFRVNVLILPCFTSSFVYRSDGPSPDTPRLLNYMVQNDLKATFFVVGSRAISRPQMLQYEYMAGNQISVHTWAHPPLTTRTNEEIVAELGWSKEAIRQIVSSYTAPFNNVRDLLMRIYF